MKATLIIFVFLIIWLIPIPFFIRHEKNEYRKCKCKCGGDWEYFDTDSQGGRGYECNKCGRVIWISWIKEKKL